MSSITPIALIDCNNFFVSCERLFRPDLADRPVVVLSSNDGCVISRSNEAKALGFAMGEPYFKVRDACKRHDVAVFSSNFDLYRDISRRVMFALQRFSDTLEAYSIDEAFLEVPTQLKEVRPPSVGLEAWATEVREVVLQEVGIPVSVGVASTKTLAKVATHVAKEVQKNVDIQWRGVCDHDSNVGVCVLHDANSIARALHCMPVSEVWGVGRRLAPKLMSDGVCTAADLVAQRDVQVRARMGICGVRTVYELRGVRCFGVGEDAEMRKSLLHSQSFGRSVDSLAELTAATVQHARRVAEILRAEEVVAREISVTLRVARRHTHLAYVAFDTEVLSVHSNDTLTLAGVAVALLARMYRPGVAYKKVGVLVRDIVPEGALPCHTLFGSDVTDRTTLMDVLDMLRGRYGAVVRLGAECGTTAWHARHTLLSPRYTTAWEDLKSVYMPG